MVCPDWGRPYEDIRGKRLGYPHMVWKDLIVHSFHQPAAGPPPSRGRHQSQLLGSEILCLTSSFSGSLLRELSPKVTEGVPARGRQ